MPDTVVEVEVAAPIQTTWQFVNQFHNWAHLMPGYQSYEPVDANRSLWTLKSDVGIFQRTVKFEVNVSERREPEHMAFTMKAIGENLSGDGSFSAVALDENRTGVTFRLSMRMGGMLGPVGNALLETMLPRDARALALGVKEVIEQRKSA